MRPCYVDDRKRLVADQRRVEPALCLRVLGHRPAEGVEIAGAQGIARPRRRLPQVLKSAALRALLLEFGDHLAMHGRRGVRVPQVDQHQAALQLPPDGVGHLHR